VGVGGGGIDVEQIMALLKLDVLVLCRKVSSLLPSVGGISSMGDSKAGGGKGCWRYLGVSGSDEAGGEM